MREMARIWFSHETYWTTHHENCPYIYISRRLQYLASIPCKCGILDGIVAKPSVGKNHNCIANIFMKKERKEVIRSNFHVAIISSSEK